MTTKNQKTNKKILVIEDDTAMRVALEQGLLPEGYLVETATDGETGLRLAMSSEADLILLDLMLPKLGGFEILKSIRRNRPGLPVIILTAKGEMEEKIQGFEYGADDYVVKPFSVRELLLRMAAVLRRSSEVSDRPEIEKITIGKARVDFKSYRIEKDGKTSNLPLKEAKMLQLMAENPNQVISRAEFLETVWGYQSYPTTRTVDTHVLNLRQKLEPDPDAPKHILTVHGVGYMFVP